MRGHECNYLSRCHLTTARALVFFSMALRNVCPVMWMDDAWIGSRPPPVCVNARRESESRWPVRTRDEWLLMLVSRDYTSEPLIPFIRKAAKSKDARGLMGNSRALMLQIRCTNSLLWFAVPHVLLSIKQQVVLWLVSRDTRCIVFSLFRRIVFYY